MTTSVVDNGVNVEALLGAREAFADTPEIARFQWRSTVTWINGTHSCAGVDAFFGSARSSGTATTFAFDIDHPQQFAAQDHGITPVEYVLVALGGCLTAGVAAVAQQRGSSCGRCRRRSPPRWTCTASSAPTRTSATASAACGWTTAIDADASPAEIKALVAQSQKRSAVYDILTNPTAVSVTVS